jgi:hypothetical protein
MVDDIKCPMRVGFKKMEKVKKCGVRFLDYFPSLSSSFSSSTNTNLVILGGSILVSN